MNAIRTYNVEAGLPTLDEARRLVIEEIKRAKPDRVNLTRTSAQRHKQPHKLDSGQCSEKRL
jgi:hypothetical protein